jgi:hypothetical protein
MNIGFQSWKDIIEVLLIPVSLAFLALFWPEVQAAARRRAFYRLIVRELEELSPFPETAKQGDDWYHHLRKEFIHQKIFRAPSENSQFILSLSPDMVYLVSQLWGAFENRDAGQWLHFLDELSKSKYDEQGEIKKAHQQWASVIDQYTKLNRV